MQPKAPANIMLRHQVPCVRIWASFVESKDCKRPHPNGWGLMLALPVFPGRRQPSIVGRSELNYRVRNGNGWTLALISTNYLCYPVSRKQTVLYCPSRLLSSTYFYHHIQTHLPEREAKSNGNKRSAACFELVTRTGFEPMLTA